MKKTCLICVLFTFLLSACTLIPLPSAAKTPIPSTFTPTANKTTLPSTITPTASKTPVPPTFTLPAPSIKLRKRQIVSEGGFSFQVPLGYTTQTQNGNVIAVDPNSLIMITIIGNKPNPSRYKEETAADLYLVSLFSESNGEYEKGDSKAVTIDGIQGTAYDITGSLSGDPLQGEAVVVKPEDDIVFFGLGFIFTDGDEERWESWGNLDFKAVMDSVIFTNGVSSQPATCKVAEDDTYGYSKDNPIRVGGDWMEGPARERAYLSNLVGATGQSISYYRNGSMNYGGTILDEFVIATGSKKVKLYIDEYSWSEPLAPVDFECIGPFQHTGP